MTSATTTIPSPREWWPLEASPEVFTKLARAWGVPEQYSFVDVFSLDDEIIDNVIPKPVHAVILLFPDTEEIVKARTAEKCMDAAKSDILWIPQIDLGHSCGTFALVHALGQTHLAPILKPFFETCKSTAPKDRTALFGSNKDIFKAHQSAIAAGQSIVRESDWEDADHFLSFVHAEVDGEQRVVELDGNPPRNGPLDRGKASGDLLKDVVAVVKDKYIPHAGDSIHFSMIALVG